MKCPTLGHLKQIDFRFRAGGGWCARQVDLARLAGLAGLAGLAVLFNLIDLDGVAFENARARAYNGGVLRVLYLLLTLGCWADTRGPGDTGRQFSG